MDEDDTNVEPMFDDHSFDDGYNIDSLEDIGMMGRTKKKKQEKVDGKYMDEDNTNVELMFDDGFDEGYGIDSLEDIEMIEFRNIRDKDADIGHMINMKKGGISVGQIYRALANQAGGCEYLSFIQRDLYNKIAKQRCQLLGDAYLALKYLEDQVTNDPSLYFNHHMDADSTLQIYSGAMVSAW
ncbi:uncharacterized protein LOC107620980 [Arachis ipaensis]|uniref:uncharacterized protein LOC107620980 n=1 Tax=Arachis ipaensis TaxID=130454 RepID=UPI0007AF6DAD|nr:uncharacterized protein LOC107620980 [Arachis ipaensis]